MAETDYVAYQDTPNRSSGLSVPGPSNIEDCHIIQLPKITNAKGNLTFLEGGQHIPFNIRRVYWLYDVPGDGRREGHAYKQLQEFVIALSGSFEVVLDDGSERRAFLLNRSYFGLYVPSLIWRHTENFSTNSVCLILASLPYSEQDYIRDYDEYLRSRLPPLKHHG